MATPEVYEPRLNWFVDQMKAKLSKPENQAKGEWRDSDIPQLLDHLEDELDEMYSAIAEEKPTDDILAECADVANLAMMVADKVKTVRETENV